MKKAIKELINKINDEKIPHLAMIKARIENNCENLPDWFKDKSPDYYEGLLDGAYSEIEALLHAYNAYGGFVEMAGEKLGSEFSYRSYFIK